MSQLLLKCFFFYRNQSLCLPVGAAYCAASMRGFCVLPRLHCLVDGTRVTTCQRGEVFVSGISNVGLENELIISQ